MYTEKEFQTHKKEYRLNSPKSIIFYGSHGLLPCNH